LKGIASMNIRRGMFRLWVIASILFVIGVGAISYSSIREEFRYANIDANAEYKKYGGYLVVPADCAGARGVAGTDYNRSQKDGLCWYAIDNFRRLNPEYKNLNDEDLSNRLYEKAGQPIEHLHPWRKVMETASIAFGVPLVVLALGYSLLWVFAGFRA
jgi:hypothetical protein